ncbi:MAG TPA: DUF3995 domain-containing protein, partial [Geodermatophilus sp.]|nr:DUF3995 domain-containing protein [Geodermatophilus sp.]
RLLVRSAYGAAVLAALSAAVSAYWLAGGTWLLSTVGGVVEEQGRQGGALVTAGLALVVVVKLAVAVLALALAHPPPGRRLRRLVPAAALLAGGVLAVYGGALVVVGAVALTGVLGEPADSAALRWHVLLWDPWLLLWGVLLVVAALAARRVRAG